MSDKTELVYGKIMVIEASPLFLCLPAMLTVQFNKTAGTIKALREVAEAFADGNCSEFKYDVTQLDNIIKVVDKNNDMTKAIMSKCVG